MADCHTALLQVFNKRLVGYTCILAGIVDPKSVFFFIIFQVAVQHPACRTAAHRTVIRIDFMRINRQGNGINKISCYVVYRIHQ